MTMSKYLVINGVGVHMMRREQSQFQVKDDKALFVGGNMTQH